MFENSTLTFDPMAVTEKKTSKVIPASTGNLIIDYLTVQRLMYKTLVATAEDTLTNSILTLKLLSEMYLF